MPGQFYLHREEVDQTDHQNGGDDHGQHVSHVEAHELVVNHLQTGAFVGLCHEILPAPAVAGGAEEDEQQRAAGQQQIADDEVLAVQNVAAGDGMDIAPDVIAQDTGQTQQEESDAADQAGLLPAPAGELADAGDDVLKHSQNSGEGSKGHEQEEQAAPELTHGNVVEHIGKGHEDQGGTALDIHAVGRTGGEDDQTGAQGHHGVQHADTDRFAHQGVVFTDVAAENGHGADAQTQGEEGLIHCTDKHVEDAFLLHLGEGGDQVELQTLAAALQEQTVGGQDPHQNDQTQHHPLGDPLQALLDTHGNDGEAADYHDAHVNSHLHGVGQHSGEHGFCGSGVKTRKDAGGSVHEVLQHPAGDGGVEHHQDDIADEADVAVPAPFAAGLQLRIHLQGALLCGAAHGEFHGQHRHTQNQQEDQIDQYEGAAAVLTSHPGKFPDIADADGTACTEQDEAKTAAEVFSLHIYSSKIRKTDEIIG